MSNLCRVRVAILPMQRATRVIAICNASINASLHGAKLCRLYVKRPRSHRPTDQVVLWLEVETPDDALIATGYVHAVIDHEPMLSAKEKP